jgi:hypothetical protein
LEAPRFFWLWLAGAACLRAVGRGLRLPGRKLLVRQQSQILDRIIIVINEDGAFCQCRPLYPGFTLCPDSSARAIENFAMFEERQLASLEPNKVDLPMPGSPPISTKDPGTIPPLNTDEFHLSPMRIRREHVSLRFDLTLMKPSDALLQCLGAGSRHFSSV